MTGTAGAPLLRGVTHALSRLGGVAAAWALPRPLRAPVWGAFARAYGARLGDAAAPLNDYADFQSFFTRGLKPGLRPIDRRADVWVSPVDALWLSHERVRDGAFVPVKGNVHSLAELLAEPDVERYRNGFVATFYLRPGDYHRIHAPCALTVSSVRHVPGVLWPVNSWGQRVPGLFARNERLILSGDGEHGPMAWIWVGATMVGSMAFTHPALGTAPGDGTSRRLEAQVARGDELGMFRFGSTVIVVGTTYTPGTLTPPCEVRVGQAVCTTGPAPDHEGASV